MTLRTKSRGQQWVRWLLAAAFAVCAYVVAFRVLYEGSLGDVFGAMQLRVLLPVLAAFGAFAYETRWDGVVRREKVKVRGAIERSEIAERSAGLREQRNFPTGSEGTVGASVPLARNQAAADSAPNPQPQPTLSGEELYAEARAMPHQPVPDCEQDGEYLKLLAQSAELGDPLAMAKLGDYAMWRGWTVEAYYWLWRAKRSGMGNLERTLLQVRSEWANRGFCRESENEYECFTHEQGTVGYALLSIDARYNAYAAKAWLAECAPEFLVGGGEGLPPQGHVPARR